MTKKNAKKTAARARQKALGGKYLSHLRIVDSGDGGDGGGPPEGFFDQVTKVIRAVYPDANFQLADEINRLEIGIGSHRFAALTPINAVPKWPLSLRNMTPGATEPDAYLKAWECESTDDVLTVLRWPDLRPRSVNDSVNQIRYFQENPAKHVWAQVGTSVLHPVVECQSCKATLLLNWGETVDEVAWMAFESWRRRDEKPTRHRRVTLSRAMGVTPIPPRCPGNLASTTETTKRYRVCAECRHVRSLHVPPEQATAGHYGCMHEDVANGSGGAGDWCSCSGYREVIEGSFGGYLSSLRPADIVAD